MFVPVVPCEKSKSLNPTEPVKSDTTGSPFEPEPTDTMSVSASVTLSPLNVAPNASVALELIIVWSLVIAVSDNVQPAIWFLSSDISNTLVLPSSENPRIPYFCEDAPAVPSTKPICILGLPCVPPTSNLFPKKP